MNILKSTASRWLSWVKEELLPEEVLKVNEREDKRGLEFEYRNTRIPGSHSRLLFDMHDVLCWKEVDLKKLLIGVRLCFIKEIHHHSKALEENK